LEEKQRLEEQIQQAGALLQSKNVDIETINEFNQLKEKLSKHNLSLEDIIGFANVFPPSLLGLKKKIDRLLERNAQFIAKVETQKLRFEAKAQAEQLTSDIKYKTIPSNATIRREFVKWKGKLLD
jgi:hypothetical protein